VKLTALSWNLFHGRDHPPGDELFTWRSRLLRKSERNATHVQVNQDLLDEFAAMLAGAEWDVALLQECPPRFAAPLARACDAEAHRVLTSRNSFAPLRQLAARINPDLIASNEGGSNLTLVRKSFRCDLWPSDEHKSHRKLGGAGDGTVIAERREVAIHTGPLERRAMALTRVALPTESEDAGGAASPRADLCVANLHASANRVDLAAEDVLRAAGIATEWAGEAPLLFGGDLNLQPAKSGEVFDELRERFGLATPTAPSAIDHLLARGLEMVERPRRWPDERREVRRDGLALRLSDHSPVEATFALP
jgi:endonuclease/exonuclease/phosphatase family metal-dependent hydrolase